MKRPSVKYIEEHIPEELRLYSIRFTLHDADGGVHQSFTKIGGQSPDDVIGKLKGYYREHPDICKALDGPVVDVQVSRIEFIKTVDT